MPKLQPPSSTASPRCAQAAASKLRPLKSQVPVPRRGPIRPPARQSIRAFASTKRQSSPVSTHILRCACLLHHKSSQLPRRGTRTFSLRRPPRACPDFCLIPAAAPSRETSYSLPFFCRWVGLLLPRPRQAHASSPGGRALEQYGVSFCSGETRNLMDG